MRSTSSGGSAFVFDLLGHGALRPCGTCPPDRIAGEPAWGALRRLSQVAFDSRKAESDDEQVEDALVRRGVEISGPDFPSQKFQALRQTVVDRVTPKDVAEKLSVNARRPCRQIPSRAPHAATIDMMSFRHS